MTVARSDHQWILDYLDQRLTEADREMFERRLIDEPLLLDHTHAVMALRVGLREVQRVARSGRSTESSVVELGNGFASDLHGSGVRPRHLDGLN